MPFSTPGPGSCKTHDREWSRRACGRLAGCQHMFGGPEGLLNCPKLFVAQHGLERVEIGVGVQHEDAIESASSSTSTLA
jgi:hypothetical protein